MTLRYYRNQVRPETWLWILDDDEKLADLSSGTFSTRIGHVGSAALKQKTTGFTGAVGSGKEGEVGAVPNLKIAWVTGDLDIVSGEYTLQIQWDIGTDTPRFFFRDIEIGGIIGPPA